MLVIRIQVEKILYYQGSENKGADLLRGYREADLRLCFRICKNPVSHDAAHYRKRTCFPNSSKSRSIFSSFAYALVKVYSVLIVLMCSTFAYINDIDALVNMIQPYNKKVEPMIRKRH